MDTLTDERTIVLDHLDFEVLCQCAHPETYCNLDAHPAAAYLEYPCGQTHPVCSRVAVIVHAFALGSDWAECNCIHGWHYYSNVTVIPIAFSA